MCSSIEYLSNALKVLLTSSIPNLQFDSCVFDFKEKSSEFDAHGDLMIFHKLIRRHSMHQARFTNATISNNNKFKQMIEILRWQTST